MYYNVKYEHSPRDVTKLTSAGEMDDGVVHLIVKDAETLMIRRIHMLRCVLVKVKYSDEVVLWLQVSKK